MKWEANRTLIGNTGVIAALTSGTDSLTPAQKGVEAFERLRAKYLIYR